MKESFFLSFEIMLFMLPALPSSLRARLLILGVYSVGHFIGLQRSYIRFKRRRLKGDVPTL